MTAARDSLQQHRIGPLGDSLPDDVFQVIVDVIKRVGENAGDPEIDPTTDAENAAVQVLWKISTFLAEQ